MAGKSSAPLKIIPHDLFLAHEVSIGASLVDTLDEFINDGHIEPQLAMKILGHFDRLTAEILGEKVKARMTFKASLDTYRFCDEVWTFQLKDVNFKLDGNTTLHTEKLKIVAMGTKKVDEK